MPACQCIFGSLHSKLSGSGVYRYGLDGTNRLIIENSAGLLNVLLLSLFVATWISGAFRGRRSRRSRLNLGQNVFVGIDQLGGFLNFFSVHGHGRSLLHFLRTSVNLFKLLAIRRSSLSIRLGGCVARSFRGGFSGAMLGNLGRGARGLSGRSVRRSGNASGCRSRRRAVGARVFSSASAQNQSRYCKGAQGAQKAGPGGLLEEC